MKKPTITTFKKSPRVWIRVYKEKSLFPMSGKKGYVVEKMKLPTYNKGSQSTALKYYKTKAQAITYARKQVKK